MVRREHILGRDITGLGIGGVIRSVVEVATTDDIRQALLGAVTSHSAWAVLGNGGSTLIADTGFDGILLRCVGTQRQHLHAGSLVFAGDIIGQHGSVGVQAMHGTIPAADIAEFHWMDDHGTMHVVSAEQWTAGAYLHARGVLVGIVPKHDLHESQPIVRPPLPSAQVFLPRPEMVAAIADVGWAGKSLGRVSLWKDDPSWLIPQPGATADEVVQLMSLVKQQVRDTLGVQLRDAISYLGI